MASQKRESFIYEATICFASAVSSGFFYDFTRYGLNEAVGKLNNEDYRKSLNDRVEPAIGELPAVLESPLDEIHRPIKQDGDIKLTVMRPRGEKLAVFDSDTALYLMPKTVPEPHEISGNVYKIQLTNRVGKVLRPY